MISYWSIIETLPQSEENFLFIKVQVPDTKISYVFVDMMKHLPSSLNALSNELLKSAIFDVVGNNINDYFTAKGDEITDFKMMIFSKLFFPHDVFIKYLLL